MPDQPSTTEPSNVVVDDAGTPVGTQAPEGFVPQADLEREQARARSFQSELDRAKAELATARANVTPVEPGATTDPLKGFDPDAFRRSLLADMTSATAMVNAVADLKGRFPHADPSIYERLDQFGNADALRLAVEDSHLRVAAVLDTEREAMEQKLREEYDAKFGGGSGGGNGPTAPAGDPTIADINAMSIAEATAFEKANPGVIERVLRSVS